MNSIRRFLADRPWWPSGQECCDPASGATARPPPGPRVHDQNPKAQGELAPSIHPSIPASPWAQQPGGLLECFPAVTWWRRGDALQVDHWETKTNHH